MKTKDIEVKWEENVNKAKKIIAVDKKNMQIEIATLALDVCEVKLGGNADGRYTVKRFAKEVGIRPSALSHWMHVKKRIYDKLDGPQKLNISFKRMADADLHIPASMDKESVRSKVYEMGEPTVENKFRRYLQSIRIMSNSFSKKNAADKISKDMCEEIFLYTGIINKFLLKKHPELSPVDHSISVVTGVKILNAKEAFSGKVYPRGVKVSDTFGNQYLISPKDRDVALFFKKNERRFFSIKEIAVKMRGAGSCASQLWVRRSIVKLVGLDMLQSNESGHYKWLT